MEFHNDVPIFVQIADQIENAIMSGALKEEEQAPSTTEISVHMKINPATALKGVNKLVEEGVLYKKRGLGMFVSDGAREKIRDKRKKLFFEKYVVPLLSEAEKLEMTYEELESMIKKGTNQ